VELKAYLRILLRKWWVILSVFFVTFAATIVLTFSQISIYRATATFVVTPNAEFGDVRSFASGLDILSRRTEIAMTYAEVAMSRQVRKKAAERLAEQFALPLETLEARLRGFSVESKLRAGTNVLEISVEGSDPALAYEFANAIGAETITYAQQLYETYILGSLDAASSPSSPVRPNKLLYLALGGILGLALGVGLAFLSAYLQMPEESGMSFEILDGVTGLYNKRYFMLRLTEEMARAKRNAYPLSLVMMNVDQLSVLGSSPFSAQARGAVLRRIAAFLKQYVREEDLIARLGETTFVLLLPDMPLKTAKAMMENLQAGIMRAPFEVEEYNVKLDLNSATGITAYHHNGTRQDELVAQAGFALQHAESAGYGKVSLFEEEFAQ
jgi:diguanylate cyclase (GGDEF)-like protein